tara:strand:+ start:2138 stop:2587 length:450 start_codon:yes stop_codon:yes gene_type:complete
MVSDQKVSFIKKKLILYKYLTIYIKERIKMDYYKWYECNSKRWEKVENAIANPPEINMSWGISERDKEACRPYIVDFLRDKSIKEVVCGHTWGRVHYFYRGDNGKYYSYAYKENKVQTCEEVSEDIIYNYGLPFCFDEEWTGVDVGERL